MSNTQDNEATLFILDLDRSKALHMADAGRAMALAEKALERGDYAKAVQLADERDRFFAYAEGVRDEMNDLLGW